MQKSRLVNFLATLLHCVDQFDDQCISYCTDTIALC